MTLATSFDFTSLQNVALIAVMGATGSGKSTFINKACDGNMRIGRGLESCTSEVQRSPIFHLNGRNVCLIDTPGFDDTNRPDSEILKEIAYYICEAYKQHIQLAGVVFIHRISDFRVTGVARRNMKMFQQLCGNDAMKNVVIITNMWGYVDKADGELREAELRTKSIFLEEAIENGACIIRHDNSANSARKIISELLKNDPVTLQIQREMLDQGMDLIDTAAGAELNRELMDQVKKYQKKLEELKKELDETHKNDVRAMQELQEACDELARNKAKAETEIGELRRHHTQMKEELEGRGGAYRVMLCQWLLGIASGVIVVFTFCRSRIRGETLPELYVSS